MLVKEMIEELKKVDGEKEIIMYCEYGQGWVMRGKGEDVNEEDEEDGGKMIISCMEEEEEEVEEEEEE